MNKERLLNVVKALRESKRPEQFTMRRYVNTCGTPACAFGHYAAREDLQECFSINTEEDPHRWADEGVILKATGQEIAYDDPFVLNHFDLNHEQAEDLFEYKGCDGAKTASDAADYIERFVAKAP